MKKHYIVGIIMLTFLTSSFAPQAHAAGLFKKIKKTAEKAVEGTKELGEKAVKGASSAAGRTKDWFEDRTKDLKKQLEKVEGCAEVVGLGTEWASKKASLAVASAMLKSATELQRLDPRRTALQAQKAGLASAKAGLEATRQAGIVGLEVVKGLAIGVGTLGEVVGQILSGGFDLQRVEARAQLAKLKQGELPMFGITAVIGGQKVDFDLKLNLRDPLGSAKSIIETAAKNFKTIKKAF